MWDIYNKLCTIFRDSPITIIIRNKIIVNYWSVSFCTIQVFIHLFPKKTINFTNFRQFTIDTKTPNVRVIRKLCEFFALKRCRLFRKKWKNNEVRKTPFHAEIRYWTWGTIKKLNDFSWKKSEHIAMRSMVCTMLCHRFEL